MPRFKKAAKRISRRMTEKDVHNMDKDATNAYIKTTRNKEHYVMQYRSTVSAILTLFKNLTFTDSHKSCIRRTPFAELLMPFIEDEKITHKSLKKSDYGINKILIAYNRPERAFVLGGKRMTITQTECKLILGIKSGRRRMTIVENKYGSSNSTHGLAVRRFQGIKTLRLGHLRDRIQELMPSDDPTDIEDVIRMIVLHLMTTVFFTSSGDCVKWAYLQYVEDFHRMNQYNWAKEIVDNLMKSIHDNGAVTAKGCTPIVLFWLCERSTLLQPNSPNAFPRFRKWDGRRITNALKKISTLDILPEQILEDPLVPSPHELTLIGELYEDTTDRFGDVNGNKRVYNVPDEADGTGHDDIVDDVDMNDVDDIDDDADHGVDDVDMDDANAVHDNSTNIDGLHKLAQIVEDQLLEDSRSADKRSTKASMQRSIGKKATVARSTEENITDKLSTGGIETEVEGSIEKEPVEAEAYEGRATKEQTTGKLSADKTLTEEEKGSTAGMEIPFDVKDELDDLGKEDAPIVNCVAFKSLYTELQSENTKLKEQTSELEAQISELVSLIAKGVTADFKSIDKISDLEKSNMKLTEEISRLSEDLKSRLSKDEERILRNNVLNLEEKNNNLQMEIDRFVNLRSNTQFERTTALEMKVKELQNQLDAAKAETQTLNLQVNAQEERTEKLEIQIVELKKFMTSRV